MKSKCERASELFSDSSIPALVAIHRTEEGLVVNDHDTDQPAVDILRRRMDPSDRAFCLR